MAHGVVANKRVWWWTGVCKIIKKRKEIGELDIEGRLEKRPGSGGPSWHKLGTVDDSRTHGSETVVGWHRAIHALHHQLPPPVKSGGKTKIQKYN